MPRNGAVASGEAGTGACTMELRAGEGWRSASSQGEWVVDFPFSGPAAS
jgi:hypothetical protein